jgi:hypothetical protein
MTALVNIETDYEYGCTSRVSGFLWMVVDSVNGFEWYCWESLRWQFNIEGPPWR